jgi:CheY-like chemotaxis protein/HPt (histidine-containing phosphotransfer) domain-containing protein
MSLLFMPVHCLSVANVLNGTVDRYNYSPDKELVVTFAAPGARVLVVDDIETNLRVAEGLLSPYRMTVKSCGSGVEALEAVCREDYDVVFMDHMMPEMDGVETTKCIRQLDGGRYKKLPIIALTANAVSGMREMFLNYGFNDFLSKPIDTVKLNTALEQWIPREKQDKSAVRPQYIAGEGETSLIRIDGIDVKKGVATIGGNVQNYLQTLGVFAKDGREKTGQIMAALAKDDLALYAIRVHALKSAAANVGAISLSEAARDLEVAGKAKDTAFISANNGKLLTSLETLLANVDAALAPINAEAANVSVDIGAIKDELVKLKTSIDRMDIGAINDAAKCLRDFSNAANIGADIGDILQNTLVGEYDDAAAQVDALLETLAAGG